MKRILLFTLIAFSVQIFAQNTPCVPDANNQDSLFGLWPDTIQNLPTANEGVYYESYVQLKTPAVASEVPDVPIQFSSLAIDSIGLVEALGMPSGIQMTCDEPNCVYPGNSTGCINIFGTTNAVGVHDLEFKVDGWVTAPIIGVVSMSVAVGDYVYLTGYKLVVNGSGTDVELIYPNTFDVLQNIPNPFTGTTSITYNLMQQRNVSFSVYNLMGAKVMEQQYFANAGTNRIELSANDLSSGIYFYTLSNGQEVVTKRMIIAGK
tara:strand:- start:1198 stop:1986 length:789 start_codon:yes stop_codon:yes gene_type:complete